MRSKMAGLAKRQEEVGRVQAKIQHPCTNASFLASPALMQKECGLLQGGQDSGPSDSTMWPGLRKNIHDH